MKENKACWIGGAATAFLGLALVRLLSPDLEGLAASIAAALGYTLVTAGITVIAIATRRDPADAFVTVERDEAKRN